MRTRVKICGMTRKEDVRAAVEAGADAIGFVFYPASPRAISIEQAQQLACELPPFVTTVGLFVNADRDTVHKHIEQIGLDLLQFHGDETPEQCRGYGRPYMKAIRMRPEVDLPFMREHYSDASGLLLDTYKKGVPGGTGATFNWDLVPPELASQVVLAGGLSAENVAAAIQHVHPYGVDVSGGVEQAKGIKDRAKIVAFMGAVNEQMI